MNKKLIWGVVIAVVVIGLLVVAYILQGTPEFKSDRNIKAATEATTADWKTYTNEKYGFSFEYPVDWNVEKDGGSGIADYHVDLIPQKALIEYKNKYGNESISMAGASVFTSNLSPKEWFMSTISPESIVEEKNLTINGNQVYYSEVSSEAYTDVSYTTSNQKLIVYFVIRIKEQGVNYNNDYTMYLAEFEKILSTFKFTSSEDSSPIISSVTPVSGPIGTVITIKGKNLSGIEGTPDIIIKNSKGDLAYIQGGTWKFEENVDTLQIKLPSQVCSEFKDNSMTSCSKFMTISPGVYSFYEERLIDDKDLPENVRKSNEVKFTVTNNPVTSPTPTTSEVQTYAGSNFSIKYPASWVYFKYSCNIAGIAFWPKVTAPSISTGNTCPMSLIDSAPIVIITEGKAELRVQDKNYQDAAKLFTITN